MYLKDSDYIKLLDLVELAVQNTTNYRLADLTKIETTGEMSEIGLCNPRFHESGSEKYRQHHQICPFDKRLELSKENLDGGSGCYYFCRLDENEEIQKEEALSLVSKAREVFTNIDKVNN